MLDIDSKEKKERTGSNDNYDINTKVNQMLVVISCCEESGSNEWFVELVQGVFKLFSHRSKKNETLISFFSKERLKRIIFVMRFLVTEGFK
jgi:hypothetical protein